MCHGIVGWHMYHLEFKVRSKERISQENFFFVLSFEDDSFEIKFYSRIHCFNVLPIILKNIISSQVVPIEKSPIGKQPTVRKFENLKHRKVEQLTVLISIVLAIILSQLALIS